MLFIKDFRLRVDAVIFFFLKILGTLGWVGYILHIGWISKKDFRKISYLRYMV